MLLKMPWLALLALILVSGCAFSYGKDSWRGAIACVDITGPGFSWKCVEQSTVPPLPDGQYIPEPKP